MNAPAQSPADDPVPQAPVDSVPEAAAALDSAFTHLCGQQQPNGAFGGEVVWNTMLISQYVFMHHILGREIPPERAARIRHAIRLQRQPDGGQGMHPHSGSWVFHTTLAYVALRLLGDDPDEPLARETRAALHKLGGAYTIPAWGRIWLAMLGLYPWEGVQPIVPELWLLPERAPAHPSRLYCHMRLIYLGLSYVYGARIQAAPSTVLDEIGTEIFPDGRADALFERVRDTVAPSDLYETPAPALTRVLHTVAAVEGRLVHGRVGTALRKRALYRALREIDFEFESTGYVCLSPVNGMLFCLAVHHDNPHDRRIDRALEGLEYWVWEDDREGMRIAGARSDIWDTSFVLQLLSEAGRGDGEVARDAARWLAAAQMRADIPHGARHHRAPARGGWGFADERHPWPVSDCTAEALEALLERDDLSHERVLEAVDFILLRQNEDGGFGSYESRRGPMVLRDFNPAEIYGNCMLEYSYTECTASCLKALARVQAELGDRLDDERAQRVATACGKARDVLQRAQGRDGAWTGFWGINHCYGTYFAVSALRACGVAAQTESMISAGNWLVAHQREDGGWGETHHALIEERYVEYPPGEASSCVQTAWALLTLLQLDERRFGPAMDRAARFLVSRQQAGGGWADERASGVFFNTAVLDYRLYPAVFPTWALARYVAQRSGTAAAQPVK